MILFFMLSVGPFLFVNPAIEMPEGLYEKPYVCSTCGQAFDRQNSLFRHCEFGCATSLRSSETRKFACEICGSRFIRKHHLVSHLNSFHSDKKPHVCPTCGKAYSWKPSLSRHQKMECGREPQFACDICDTRFVHKHHLINHRNTVHHAAMQTANDQSKAIKKE